MMNTRPDEVTLNPASPNAGVHGGRETEDGDGAGANHFKNAAVRGRAWYKPLDAPVQILHVAV